MNNPSVRIGVIGEAGVGKSELVHCICHPSEDLLSHLRWDRFVPAVATTSYRSTWIEFLVFPSQTLHPLSRQMLYHMELSGLLLVCDCSAPHTFLHGVEWVEEALRSCPQLARVPLGLVLSGPEPVNWAGDNKLSGIIDTLVGACPGGNVPEILDLTGYLGSLKLAKGQLEKVKGFYDRVLAISSLSS